MIVRPNSPSLRTATLIDLQVVIGWVADAQEALRWLGPGIVFPLSPSMLEQQLSPTPETAFIVLDAEKNAAAFGQVLFDDSHPRAHLARLIVDPKRRGEGWGRVLATELMSVVPAAPKRYFTLNVLHDNHVAIGLYKSLGFTQVDRPTGSVEKPLSVFMRRDT